MILKVELWHDTNEQITILPQFNVPSNKLDLKKQNKLKNKNQKVVHKKHLSINAFPPRLLFRLLQVAKNMQIQSKKLIDNHKTFKGGLKNETNEHVTRWRKPGVF